MSKKYVFIDLDGTILDHKSSSVPDSTVKAFKIARENGHELILTTGRPPSLFYGIDKLFGFESYIAANGRLVVERNEIIYQSPIPQKAIENLVQLCKQEKIDIAFESIDDFVLESNFDNLYIKFCDFFHLEYPRLEPGYYKEKKIYQISMFYDKDDFKKYEKITKGLTFEYSCRYGLDVTSEGGFKETGIKIIQYRHNLNKDDIIAIGDGYNDISMLQYAGIGVAMGNAPDEVKRHATFVTSNVEENGLYEAFVKLGLLTN
jgi:Cof subfamily protein (haloacid dehalogenase superfamily)